MNGSKWVEAPIIIGIGLYAFLAVFMARPPESTLADAGAIGAYAFIMTAIMIHAYPSHADIEIGWRMILMATLFIQLLFGNEFWELLFCHATVFAFLSVACAVSLFFTRQR